MLNLNDSSRWFVIYVKSRHEKRIHLTLSRNGYESFLPTYFKSHANSKRYELPLFPNYVFSRLDTFRVLPVLRIPGVFSIIGTGGVPTPVPEEEIEAIRSVLVSGFVPHPWPYVSQGQEVYFMSGPLRRLHGVVVDTTDEKWLVVSIHLLQRSVAVRIDRKSLAPGDISLNLSRALDSRQCETDSRNWSYSSDSLHCNEGPGL
jgi:transcription antitermination factor NusG